MADQKQTQTQGPSKQDAAKPAVAADQPEREKVDAKTAGTNRSSFFKKS